jgi:hypothetical protein
MSKFKGTLPVGQVTGTDLAGSIRCSIDFTSPTPVSGSFNFSMNSTNTAIPVNASHPEYSTTGKFTLEQTTITINGATNDNGEQGWVGRVEVTVSSNLVGETIDVYYVSPTPAPLAKGGSNIQLSVSNNSLAWKTGTSVVGTQTPTGIKNGVQFDGSFVVPSKTFYIFVNGDDHSGKHSDIRLSYEGITKNGYIVTDSFAERLELVIDPVAQSFYVNPKEYPNGLFLSKADVYFSQKPETGSNSTAWIYITKTVNGYPSSDSYITNSRVEKAYASVNLPTGTSIAPVPVATTFTFSDPIHLEAGEYAIVVGSDNAKYRVFVSELGSTDLATGKLISTNPDGNVGSFFMSQNARTWTADQTKDMMFDLHKCVFNTNSLDVEMPLIKDSDSIISDMISITSPDKEIAGTSLKYYSKLGGDYIPVNNNTNTKLTARTTLSSATTPYVKFNLSSTSTNLSPVIQKDKINMKFFQNAINTKLDLLVDETDPYKGNAAAKYVTKKVVLADGFDATGIRVLLDVNRLHGTSVEVFFKAVASDDFAKFEDHSYIQIPLKGDVQYSSTDNDFVIDEYKLDDFYYQLGKVNYSSFKTFIVKVVMYSDNPVNFPRVKNLRAIATS